jgi:ABC-type Fe3+/spermidine/putrescine transport system ATPase subunit
MLSIRQVTRALNGVPVLRGVDLEVVQGEILCLLGPSGCGKTTLLRVIAGLEQLDSGEVLLEGSSIANAPVHERGFGLMFQDFALFPHMNVAQNVVFGLRMQGVSAREQQQHLGDVLRLVGLAGFERRDVTQLSGGERQRVALARSLAPNPRLLMLDEPLGSLDAALAERLVIELRGIIKNIGQTSIYVTHDQQEAFAVADRVAIMNAGKIEQVDTPERLYHHPLTTFVARFLGLSNVLPVLGYDGANPRTAIGEFAVSGRPDALLLHPQGIHLASISAADAIEGVVEERVFQGESYRMVVKCKENIRLKLAVENHAPSVGETVLLRIVPEMVLPLKSSDKLSG